jgi:hypothetical protein
MGRGGFEPPTHGFSVREGQTRKRVETPGLTRTCESCSLSCSAKILEKHPDLRAVVEAWEGLSADARVQVLKIIGGKR